MIRKKNKIVVICLSSTIFFCLVLQHFFWPVRRFAREPQSFHVELARSCLTILDSTDLSTNRSVRINPSLASLPASTMQYKPKRIVISKDRVWLFFGEGRLTGFGVAFERNIDRSSDIWELKLFDGVNERTLVRSGIGVVSGRTDK